MSWNTPYRNLPIRYKLHLLSLITVGATLMLACGTVLAYYYVVRDSARNDLTVLAEIFGSNSTAALSFNDSKTAEELLSGLAAKRSILCAYLYYPDGQLFAGYRRGSEPGKPPLVHADQDRSWFENHRIKILHRIRLGSQTIGVVYLESDLGELNARLKQFTGIVVAILLIAGLFSFLLSSRLAA